MYLGKGVFRATEEKPFLFTHTPAEPHSSRAEHDDKSVPPTTHVYDLESPVPWQHT